MKKAINEEERGAPDISLGAQIQTALARAQLQQLAAQGDRTAMRLLAQLDTLPAEREANALRERQSGKAIQIRAVLDKSFTTSLAGLGQLDRALTGTTASIVGNTASVGAATLKYGAFAAALAQAISLTGGLGAAAATASGSLLVLPAVGIAAAIAVRTLKLGVEGLSEAFDAESAEDYAKAVKDFPPAMRETTDAVRALRPQLDGLQLGIRTRLFEGLGKEVEQLGGTYLPVLRGGLADIAGGFNQAARNAATLARDGRAVDDVRLILDQTGQSVRALSGGAAPLLQIIRDLAAVGSEFLPGFASGFADGATSLADFVSRARETGQLREWMSAGLSAVGDFVTTIGNLARIVFTIFGAANTHGASLFATLSALTGSMLAFLRSAEGTVALQQFFGGLHDAASGLLTLLEAVGRAFASDTIPAVGQLGTSLGLAFTTLAAGAKPAAEILAVLAPLAGVAAQALASVLVPALGAVSGIAAELGPVFGELVQELVGGALADGIRELTPDLLELARAAKPLISAVGHLLVQALRTAVPALSALLGALTPIATELGGAFIQAIEAALPLVTILATVFSDVLLAAWEQARPVLPVLVESIRQLVTALDLSAATPSLIETGTLLGKILADALRNLVPLIPPLVAAWVQFWSEGLLPMTPLLLRIVSELLPELLPLLGELVPVITQALTIMTVWNAALLKLAALFVEYVIPALKLFINDGVKPVFRNALEIISSALGLIQGVITTGLALLSGDWSRAWRGVQDIASAAWRLLTSGAELGVRSLLGFFGGLPGQILSSFGNIGSLLLEAGKNLIRGFLRGIESMISSVRAKLRELTDLLPDWKGPPERDAKLLRANGVLIMRSLVDGFEAEEPAVRRYLTELTDRIPAATLAVETGPVATQRLATQAAATAGRDDRQTADLAALVDAIERLAARPVVVQVGATEIARATAEGQHALSRR
ncbi:hypothetical protein SK571_35980 [Lentzea sp. BCCO 10_0798]|uniref:Phage-related protein n=1 Tax=Lentzea kristufekii TaxID=3095430 RepID=A0ABU4U2K7_9PSEU|nr:hypothetical protein [Lentzea sp. BCCO 10_0798]MDX8054799.1 hypothetical protein [Lentzea sp. BCCO 10_0798]